jgi:amino acid transporter
VVDQRTRSRSLMAPVLGGIILILALVAGIYFRVQLWHFLKFLGRNIGDWLTNWVPDHPGQTTAIFVFAVVALGLNWIAHIQGRLRAWVFVIVIEVGLWLLFWFKTVIPSFNHLVGLDIESMSFAVAISSAAIVIALTGLVFWILEAREEWRKSRRREKIGA